MSHARLGKPAAQGRCKAGTRGSCRDNVHRVLMLLESPLMGCSLRHVLNEPYSIYQLSYGEIIADTTVSATATYLEISHGRTLVPY